MRLRAQVLEVVEEEDPNAGDRQRLDDGCLHRDRVRLARFSLSYVMPSARKQKAQGPPDSGVRAPLFDRFDAVLGDPARASASSTVCSKGEPHSTRTELTPLVSQAWVTSDVLPTPVSP